MKILVIFTGGTIGSCIKDGYISTDEKCKYMLIDMYKNSMKNSKCSNEYGNNTDNTKMDNDSQICDEDIIFNTVEPYTVLSENLNGEHITELVRCIGKNLKLQKYDGIIVTHGTDTLQYTAAALDIVFSDINIPLVLVSSNYPLEDKRANGLDNFIGAVNHIKKGEKGVYASYKNPGEELVVFSAASMLRYDIYSDKIRSLPGLPYKEIGINRNIDGKITDGKDINISEVTISPESFSLQSTSPVKYILPYPGITYDIPDNTIKAILFGTYHSGTIQTSSKELVDFCREMRNRNIPMYICGVPEGIGYESTKYYEELGIEVLPYGTDIYWYMKFWIMSEA